MQPKPETEPIRASHDDEPSVDGSVMSLVRRLSGVSFEWRDDVQSGHSGHDLGVIAQEVEQVFPELVHTNAQGYKTVNCIGLFAPLIEAVKELDARLAALEAAIAAGYTPVTPAEYLTATTH